MKPPRFDWLKRWWSFHQARKTCMHHDLGGNPANTEPATSWIIQELIDMGRRKLFRCCKCEKVWIV